MIVDTSVILAIYFNEPLAKWCSRHLQANLGMLSMSTVSVTECLIRLKDRQPDRFQELESTFLTSGISFIAPDLEQARIAAAARLVYPLNLGDCFVYALAKLHNKTILTLDRDFRNLDVPVLIPED